MVARMGFDLIEVGIEGTCDLDYRARRGDREGERARRRACARRWGPTAI